MSHTSPTAVYDAWNRLVAVRKAYRDGQGAVQTGSVVAAMRYDGRGRRIVKAVRNSADLDCTNHCFYDGDSVIELRNGGDANRYMGLGKAR